MVVILTINDQGGKEPIVVFRQKGVWALPKGKLDAFRIEDSGSYLLLDGDLYRPFEQDESASFHYDSAHAHLHVQLSPCHYCLTKVSAGGRKKGSPAAVTSDAVTAFFLDYDLEAYVADGKIYGLGAGNIGISGNWGVVHSRWGVSGEKGDLYHLESSAIFDDIEGHRTLVIGDGITRGMSVVAPVTYRGISWFSNFDIDPDFVSYSLPMVSGLLMTSENVDLRVNGSSRFQAQIPRGRFGIGDIPAPDGFSEIELMTRNHEGGTTIGRYPVYIATELLGEDIAAYGVTLGWERDSWAEEDFQYSQPFAQGILRYGLSGNFTLSGALEANESVIDGVLGGEVMLGHLGVLSFGTGLSWKLEPDEVGPPVGYMFRVSFSRKSPTFNFGGDVSYVSQSYRQVGGSDEQHVETRYNFWGSRRLFGGMMNVSAHWMNSRTDDDVGFVSLNYSRTLGEMGYLSVGGMWIEGETNELGIRLSWTVPLGGGKRVSSELQRHTDGTRQARLGFGKSIGGETGVGYNIDLGVGEEMDGRAMLEYRGAAIDARMNLFRRFGKMGWHGHLGGGLLVAEGKLIATREADRGTVLVQVPQLPQVPVYINNRKVGETGEEGWLAFPQSAHVPGKVSIDDTVLPLSVSMNRTSADVLVGRSRVSVVSFTPLKIYRKEGVVQFLSGEFPPPGTLVKTMDHSDALPVGYEGRVYLTSQTSLERYFLTVGSETCEFEVDFNTNQSEVEQNVLPVFICH
ncbi:fimbria/pilus outer membrane usher protein [Emcibacter nanhaiensis]|nr:fimbria/pilus outer membrane usher protein [Emcibacter nanhaiensis]